MEDKLLAITWCKALSARDVWRRPSALGGSAVWRRRMRRRPPASPTSSARPSILAARGARTGIAQMSNYFLAHGVTDPAAAHRQAIIALGNVVKQ